ncbi:MAG: hypothetical protein NC187_00795 [Candidatus Amulumruptor caecigallinarius]|nr:hypothetical protein [Candidatus Amulumruptor caecigallinarius]MCM1396013.1 hypothetical protein [Candidatus Amulumruptor caecigallinarius]MCM1454551.1 hypothetical protein [bacterium]
MKKILLLTVFTLLLGTTGTQAHQVDPWTIVYSGDELYDADSNPTGFDEFGAVPPGDAEYYLHTFSNNAYYPLTKVDGTNPVEYTGYMPVLVSNFKIFAEGYWTSGTSGTERDQYIYGSGDNNAGVYKEQYKNLSHPGQNDLMIENGGTWYGVEIRFYPDGTSSSSTPQLYLVGASQTPELLLEATGTATGQTTGTVDFTIKPGGVVNSQKQSYKVTMTYTGYTSKSTVTREMTSDGLTGTFKDVTDLEPGASNKMDLTVTLADAPVSAEVDAQSATSHQTLTATATCYIVTPSIPYLVGDIKDNVWDPANGIKGQPYLSYYRTLDPNADNSEVMCWFDVPLQDTYRFSFITKLGTWDEANSAIRYSPTNIDDSSHGGTEYCDNIDDNVESLDPFEGNWYAATAATGSNSRAWAPAIAKTSGQSTGSSDAASKYYAIFLNQKTNEVAVQWLDTPTAIAEILASPMPESMVVDVYNLQGSMIRHHVSADGATSGLPHGIYIVGGKKVAVD